MPEGGNPPVKRKRTAVKIVVKPKPPKKCRACAEVPGVIRHTCGLSLLQDMLRIG